MKMLFENWRGFVNEQAEIIDFPAPESRGDDEEYFLFSKEQINILDKVVKDFGGSLDGIVQKSSSEAERLVAEEDSEGEEDEVGPTSQNKGRRANKGKGAFNPPSLPPQWAHLTL